MNKKIFRKILRMENVLKKRHKGNSEKTVIIKKMVEEN